jgi:hypothetical protein
MDDISFRVLQELWVLVFFELIYKTLQFGQNQVAEADVD